MASEFNYVVNLDTSRVMTAMSEIRSQIGMALQGPTGFAGPASGIGGGPGTTVQNVVQGTMSGLEQMRQSMIGATNFGTFTNPAMANQMHYGPQQATTNLEQEWLVQRYGLSAAQSLRPPGVSPTEYASSVDMNRFRREQMAREEGYAGFTSALATGVAFPVGYGAGATAAKVASKALGLGATAAGVATFGIGMIASEVLAGATEDYFADVSQKQMAIREMGERIGYGRDLTASQRSKRGGAALGAAKDAGMHAQSMADVLSAAGPMGMMPQTTDPGEARQKYAELARAIDEGAQMLHTSLGNAMQMIKGMTGMGMGAREGALNMVGIGADVGMAPTAVYQFGMQGASVARSNLISGRQGFDMFTQGLRQAAGSPDLQFVGGVRGGAALIAGSQMQMAKGGFGQAQLMAMSGGGDMPTGGFETISGALDAMGEGGDIIGNYMRFQATSDEQLRGLGAGGLRKMTRANIDASANMLMDQVSSLDIKTARINVMMSRGYNQAQARTVVRGLFNRGGGGGGGGAGAAARLEAAQSAMSGRVPLMGEVGPMDYLERQATEMSESFLGMVGLGAGLGAGTGAVMGAGVFSVPGALAGAGLGAAAGGLSWLSGSHAQEMVGDAWDDIGTVFGGGDLAQARTDRSAARMDAAQATIDAKYNIEIHSGVGGSARRVGRASLSGAFLSTDHLSDRQLGPLRQLLAAGGVSPIDSAMQMPGSIGVGGSYYDIQAARKAARSVQEPAILGKRAFNAASAIAMSSRSGGGIGGATGRFGAAIAAGDFGLAESIGSRILGLSPDDAVRDMTPFGGLGAGILSKLTGVDASKLVLSGALEGMLNIPLQSAMHVSETVASKEVPAMLAENLAARLPNKSRADIAAVMTESAKDERFQAALRRGDKKALIRVITEKGLAGGRILSDEAALLEEGRLYSGGLARAASGGLQGLSDIASVMGIDAFDAPAKSLERALSDTMEQTMIKSRQDAVDSGQAQGKAAGGKKKRGGDELVHDINWTDADEKSAIQMRTFKNIDRTLELQRKAMEHFAGMIGALTPKDDTPPPKLGNSTAAKTGTGN